MQIRAAFAAGLALACTIPLAAGDLTPAKLLEDFGTQAGAGLPFSAERGRQLFLQKSGDWSCSTCHTADPRSEGKHAVTGKAIEPLAPAANPQRFTDQAKVDKWFRRNCRDVLGRECTAREKGDLLTWLVSLR
jgi:mono/diheme cytochrome c family protein